MQAKVKDMSAEELRHLISETIKEAMQELTEDISALSNAKYLKSIEQARKDYKEGKTKDFEEVFDV
jgi:hypothetical protein